ncbi:hypothetical protein GCM10010345_84500 [Streptomyces canarius]|uniref:Integral membrane protein n=1 Tax=Streptomyces canarius TaxID=285453 RepID=A0ABQ3D9T6_9ACTN|nr:hypothetical protein GCM10010345_84500 [Streptomyces canarius]
MLAVWDDGVLTLRALSVLGTLTAVGVHAIGSGLAGPATGFVAGAAFLCVPQVRCYAQEARSYAWVGAAVVWATGFFVRAPPAMAPPTHPPAMPRTRPTRVVGCPAVATGVAGGVAGAISGLLS